MSKSIAPIQLLHIRAWKLDFIVFRGLSFGQSRWTEFPPVQHQFYEFRWKLYTSVDGQANDFIQYVIKNSDKTLEVLHVQLASQVQVEPAFLPRLRSLVLNENNIQTMQMLNTTPALMNLRELVLTHHLQHLDQRLFTSLPPRLVHLGLGLSNNNHMTDQPLFTLTEFKNTLLLFPSTLRMLSLYLPFYYESTFPSAAAKKTSKGSIREYASKAQGMFPLLQIEIYIGDHALVAQVRPVIVTCTCSYAQVSLSPAIGPCQAAFSRRLAKRSYCRKYESHDECCSCWCKDRHRHSSPSADFVAHFRFTTKTID